MKCSRRACQKDLTRGMTVFMIYNEPSTGIPRPYCEACGNKIIGWNVRDGGVQLKYEVKTVTNG